jgi:hypothetical protein
MTTIIVLIARLVLEETKSTSTGEITKLGDANFGPSNRLFSIHLLEINLLRLWRLPLITLQQNYESTVIENNFGKKWEDDDSLNMLPIYWQSIREIKRKTLVHLLSF